jgi:hypothetical protein
LCCRVKAEATVLAFCDCVASAFRRKFPLK